MTKIKVNVQAPDKEAAKREVGILDTETNKIKCVKDRVFKKDEVEKDKIYFIEELKK